MGDAPLNRPYPHGKKKIVFRSAAGFGDSFYSVCILEHLLKRFPQIVIRTRHPSLFAHLPGVITERWHKGNEDLAIHYNGRKSCADTNIWQDLLMGAGIDIITPFKIAWKPKERVHIDKIAAMNTQKKKVCVVGSPHTPFARNDGYGLDLRPKWEIFDKIIRAFQDKLFFVQIGLKREQYEIKGIDLDLVGKTSDCDTLDIATVADCFIGQNGYIIPLAESQSKPLFVVYSRKGLQSGDPLISNTKPEKILSKPTSGWAVDDEPIADILAKAKGVFGL